MYVHTQYTNRRMEGAGYIDTFCFSKTSYHFSVSCSQSDAGHLETFQAVLKDNPAVFHTCRTATSLHHHWVLMGHYNLLNDQKGMCASWWVQGCAMCVSMCETHCVCEEVLW